MTSKVTYSGGHKTRFENIRSGNTLITDAPLDNDRLGQLFAHTDIAFSGLTSFFFSVIGMKARSLELGLENSTAEVSNYIKNELRRISKIHLKFCSEVNYLDKHIKIWDSTEDAYSMHCTLHPDISMNISF
ncbi:OsmC family peroxiredoxin [Arenibacter sp. F26102]|uniref:OsmC family peroxiredoxin n=1 Tax=Arenibacter sp. F26102 TaxID=2926416 RepID=UPI001FF61E53|nr:OsmC family peroxiredoxin [Arenibacter sp. F26102]MCK0145037.1 OsmC family peroxiredoxin [Arenibacter sp. F26102]